MHLFTSAFLLGILMELQFNSFGFDHGIVVILALLVIGEFYGQTSKRYELLEAIGSRQMLLLLPVVLFVGSEAWFHKDDAMVYFNIVELYPLTSVFILTYVYFRTCGTDSRLTVKSDNNYTVFYGAITGLLLIKIFEKYLFMGQNVAILSLLLLATLNLMLFKRPKHTTS